MVVYLEAGFLVTRETVAEMLGCKYLKGILLEIHNNLNINLSN